MAYETREKWLGAAVGELAELLKEQGVPELPKLQVGCGFAKSGGKLHFIGQCFHPTWTEDGTTQIFICPTLGADPVRLLDVLLHELVHAVAGTKVGHRGRFKELCLALGLKGKMTATYAEPGTPLHDQLTAIAARLGQYPHAVMRRPEQEAKKPGSGGWIKFISRKDHGYFLRLSPKSLALAEALGASGAPTDPWGEEMVTEDELEESEDGEAKPIVKEPILYMHTAKAVREGHPSDRVFLVVGRNGAELNAWKCTLRPGGLEHPVFPECVLAFSAEALQRGNIPEGANGSAPTASFRPDSFYRRVTLAQLRVLADSAKGQS